MPIINNQSYDQMVSMAEEHLKERLGEREDLVEKREKNVAQYLEIASLCIIALKDHAPSLAEHLRVKMDRISK